MVQSLLCLDYRMEGLGISLISIKGKILSSPKCPRLALEPIHFPTQWVPVALSPQKNSWGVKVTTHLHPVNGATPPLPHIPYLHCIKWNNFALLYFVSDMYFVFLAAVNPFVRQQ